MFKSLMKIGTLAYVQDNVKATVTDQTDGTTGNAMCVENYLGVWASETIGQDPHAVHGIQAADSGIVTVGMSLETETGKLKDGFVVKTKGTCSHNYANVYLELTPDGTGCETYEWIYKLATTGKQDQLLWVAESPDASYYIAVGLEEQSGARYAVGSVSKLSASDGSLVWKMIYNGDANTNTVAETVKFTSDGGFVIGGAINNTDDIDDMNFKSGGQLENGNPFIAKISAADAAGTSAPSSFEWTYQLDTTDEAYMGSAKAIRVDSSDNIYAIIGGTSGLVKLNSSGAEQWHNATTTGVQMNDLEIVSDGIVLAGHRYVTLDKPNNCLQNIVGTCGTIWGHSIKVDLTGQSVTWSQDYGNYPGGVNQFWGLEKGKEELIYNECWGIAPAYDGPPADSSTTQTGFVLGCGTGIEGCIPLYLDVQTMLECRKDARKDWRSLTIAIDLDGNRDWSRMDNYQGGETKVLSSANEYVFPLISGGVGTINDEAYGVGLLTLDPYSITNCTYTYPEHAQRLSALALSAVSLLYAAL